jgi:hypothetical protein
MWLCVFGVAARSVTHDLVNSSRSFHTDWADGMATSQNVLFSGDCARDAEFDHPEGVAIARLVSRSLRSAGLSESEVENWRDVGWCISASLENVDFEVSVARATPTDWMLQVAPLRAPGLWARIFGPPVDHSAAVFRLSVIIASTLATGGFTGFHWRWDGYPLETDPSSPALPPTR